MRMLLEEMREKERVGKERRINKRYKMVRFFGECGVYRFEGHVMSVLPQRNGRLLVDSSPV